MFIVADLVSLNKFSSWLFCNSSIPMPQKEILTPKVELTENNEFEYNYSLQNVTRIICTYVKSINKWLSLLFYH